MLTRKICDWTKEKYDELLEKGDYSVKDYAKVFGLGAIEGAVDGVAVLGTIVFTISAVSVVKELIKK